MRTRRLHLLLGLGLLAGSLAAQPTAEAPLTDFRLPVFNAQGQRILDLSSTAVRTLSAEKPIRLELSTVHVRLYAQETPGVLEGQLFAPVAVYDEATQTVSGSGQLHAIYHDIELFGDDWTYDAPTRTIVIERNVVVTFPGELGQLLQ